jgi:hypothetical protein
MKDLEDDIRILKGVSREKPGPVELQEDNSTGDLLLIYANDSGAQLAFKYKHETLWMSQAQIASLFVKDQATISRHIGNIISEGELDESTSMQKVHKTMGRPVTLYNLDMIISIGYRVSSKQATLFRKWATHKLVQFATKGFVIDVNRLKGGDDSNHLKELRETIRDIRASEANMYREVRTICAMCQDYDPSSDDTRNMYAAIQNKLLWATVTHTAPEIIVHRADAKLENMGLSNWPNENIRKSDTTIAHNYLAQAEITTKNRLTTMLLDFFETRVEQGKLTTMAQATTETNRFIEFNGYPLLRGKGSVKRTIADKHAHKQYKLFDEKRRALRHANP